MLRLERHERLPAVGDCDPERSAGRELVVVARAGDSQVVLVLVPLVVKEPSFRRHGQELLPRGRRALRLLPVQQPERTSADREQSCRVLVAHGPVLPDVFE